MMSRDSGLTWTQVAKGSHIYEVADHGGLIVLANDRIATNHILFSWNEGGNWTGFQFWKHHIEVENVITEPRGASQEFIVYGRRNEKGVVVHVDFSSVHKRRCEGAETPGASDSDFEKYTPAASLLGKGQCLLGKKITYTRRKASSACYNGDEFERSSSIEICECQASDFECDFGFEKRSMSGRDASDASSGDWCVRQPGMPPVTWGAPKECSGTYVPAFARFLPCENLAAISCSMDCRAATSRVSAGTKRPEDIASSPATTAKLVFRPLSHPLSCPVAPSLE